MAKATARAPKRGAKPRSAPPAPTEQRVIDLIDEVGELAHVSPEERAQRSEAMATDIVAIAEQVGRVEQLVDRIAPSTGGRITDEAVILACQCNSTAFREEKRTKRAVVFTCARCGERTSVQGSVALARVPRDEMTFAVAAKVISPDPDAGKKPEPEATGEDGEPKPTLAQLGKKMFRFTVTESAFEVVVRALECIRIMNCGDPAYRDQTWQGNAIEHMAADFLSGVPPEVLRVIEKQEEAVAAEAARMLAKTGKDLPTRRATEIRGKVRDLLAEQLGYKPSEELEPSDDMRESADKNAARAAEERARAEALAADTRILDDGRLNAAMLAARDVLPETRRPIMHVGGADHYEAFARMWEKRGGFLLVGVGDQRTRDKAGKTPTLYIWLAEDPGPEVDPTIMYAELMEDDLPDARLEIYELVPGDFEELPEDEQWERPIMATARKVM